MEKSSKKEDLVPEFSYDSPDEISTEQDSKNTSNDRVSSKLNAKK